MPFGSFTKEDRKRANIAKDGKKWLAFVNSGFL